MFLKINNNDSVIYIKDIKCGYQDSVKYLPEKNYLYIYYDRPNFTFSYSDKLLMLE